MRFSTDRCLGCGLPTSKRFKTYGDFWFCSDDCFWDEVDKLLPKEYKFGRSYTDSEEFENFNGGSGDWSEGYREIENNWNAEQKKLIDMAQDKLFDRAHAESDQLRKEQEQKDRIVREKQEEKERVVREKEEAKAEQERLKDEAQAERMRPRDIPPDYRFDHTHIIGGSGQGKQHNALRLFRWWPH